MEEFIVASGIMDSNMRRTDEFQPRLQSVLVHKENANGAPADRDAFRYR
jgi:hypothetical protein